MGSSPSPNPHNLSTLKGLAPTRRNKVETALSSCRAQGNNMLFRRIAHSLPVLALLSGGPAAAQSPESLATFKSGVDLVSVTAVVRDKKGKVVKSLQPKDFIVAEDGRDRKIISIQSDVNAAASIAFLVDSSGS